MKPSCFVFAAPLSDPAGAETGADVGPSGEVSKPWETEDLSGDRGWRYGGQKTLYSFFDLVFKSNTVFFN